MTVFTFLDNKKSLIKIQSFENKKDFMATKTFTFSVEAQQSEDIDRVVRSMCRNVMAVLSGDPKVMGGNRIEWFGQTSLNANQLMETVCIDLRQQGVSSGEEVFEQFSTLRTWLMKIGLIKALKGKHG